MLIFVVVLGYLLGSIPTAYIAGYLIKGDDIRQRGDGNMGAQNAFCQLGVKTGLTVGIIDAAKGALAIFIAYAVNTPQLAVLLVGIAAVIGHNWPIFLGFRGGRGESTTIGVLLVIITVPMLIVGGITIAVLLKTKDVIKASVVLFVPLPFICWWIAAPGLLIAYSIFLPCIVGFTHYIRTRQKLMSATTIT